MENLNILVKRYEKFISDSRMLKHDKYLLPHARHDGRLRKTGTIPNGGLGGNDIKTLYEMIRDFLPSHPQKVYNIADVGCFTGMATIIFANGIRDRSGKIYAIDWFKGQENLSVSSDTFDIKMVLEDNVRNNKLEDYVEVIKGLSVDVSKQFENNFFDIIFIDAFHSYKSVKADIGAWYPKLKIGGIMCGHDYISVSVHSGVWKAVMEKFEPNVKKLPNCIWYIVKENNEL